MSICQTFHILGLSSVFDLQTRRFTLLCITNSNDDLFSTEISILDGSFEAETCVGSGDKNRFPSEAFCRVENSAPFLKQERKWVRPPFSEGKAVSERGVNLAARGGARCDLCVSVAATKLSTR